MQSEILLALAQTLYMVLSSTLLAVVIGGPLGIYLFTSRKSGLQEKPLINALLGTVVNIFRSIPFIVLLAILIPITRVLVGTSIGSTAAIVPLTIAAIPFFARLTENVLLQLPPGLLEAGRALGATPKQIVRHLLLPDALPALIDGITVTLVTLTSFSAMAGAVGGGGLGAFAIDYGYQRFDFMVLFITVVLLVILVQCFQWLGNRIARHFDHS